MTTEAPLIGEVDASADSNFFGPETYSQIFATFQTITLLTNPLSHLASSNLAKVICKRPCFTCCRAICPYKDYYYTLLSTNEGWQYLFNNVLSIGCSFCPAGPYSRWESCESRIVSSVQDIEQNGGTAFTSMIKDKNCVIGNLCPKYFYVNGCQEEKTHGIVKIRGVCENCCKCDNCCKDCCKCDCKCKCDCDCNQYYYACDILNPGKELQYTIYRYECCCDCCFEGKCCSIKYAIKDITGNTTGKIEGYPAYCDSSYVYKIQLPPEASPEIKLTIINSIFVIDALGLY